MGMYDVVGKEGQQIKCTPDPKFHLFREGDHIELVDGLYLTFEGWFVVNKGKVLITGTQIFDKWGGECESIDLIQTSNPVYKVMKEVEKGPKSLKEMFKDCESYEYP